MYAISSLMRSLYSLTGLGFFRSAADALYKVDRTKSQVSRVKNDASRAKEDLDKTREKKAS